MKENKLFASQGGPIVLSQVYISLQIILILCRTDTATLDLLYPEILRPNVAISVG